VTGEPAPGTPAKHEPAPSILPAGLDAIVVLVRHGESAWVAEGRFQGQGNPALSPLGRRQAELVAARLAHRTEPPALPLPAAPPLEIAHSPLARAAETAAAIAAGLHAQVDDDPARRPRVEPDPGLLEIGQGEWEGLHGQVIEDRWADVLAGWRRDPLTAWAPGGESLLAVDARVRISLRARLAALADAAPRDLAARSHVLGYADVPGDEPWSILVAHDGVFKVVLLALLELPLGRFWTFPFALCGITVVELRAGRPRLRLHNTTDHLAPLETAVLRERDEARARTGAL
jgi:broad specificity phosphatase PhoE